MARRILPILLLATGLRAQFPIPTITSFSPPSASAGGGSYILTVNGTNFASENFTTARFTPPGGTTPTVLSIIPGTYSTTQFQVTVPAGLIATSGTATIVVRNQGTTASDSAPASYPIKPPVITTLTPSKRTAGSATFTLTVDGSDFVQYCTGSLACILVRSQIFFGSDQLATTFVNSTRLTASVPAALIASQGNIDVTVVQPSGETSAPAVFTILGVPSVTSVSPVSRTVNNGPVTVTLSGTNFASGDLVYFDGPTTQFTPASLSSTSATTVIPASFLTSPGSHTLGIYRPADGTTSNSVPFLVNNVPSISSISPTSRTANTPGFALSVTGTNFISNEVVVWTSGATSTPLATTFGSSTSLQATVPAALLTSAGTKTITVVTIDNISSNGATFTVNPGPAITTLNPSNVTAGHAGFNLVVSGTNIPANGTIQWNGTNLTTSSAGANALQATVSASLVANAGTAAVTVLTIDGAVSPPATFTINAVPSISSLTPSSRTAGGSGFTLTVDGSNFNGGMTVQWQGSALTTTFVNAGRLTANVPGSLLTSPGTASITVLTADGLLSNAATFTINSPPTISSISPTSRTATAPGFTLTVNGLNYLNNMTVQWNGSNMATTFVSTTQLTASVPASLITTSGTANVTVLTTDSVSTGPAVFTINPAPAITTLNPSSVTAGRTAFTLTVSGTNLPASGIIRWNGANLTTSSPSANTLQATVSAALVASPGTAAITILTTDGAVSPAATLTIAPTPAITTISPSAVTEGAPAFTLTVNGTNFVSGIVVRWNGSALTTTFESATQLTAAVPASLVASPGTASVTVLTSDGVSSNAATFTIGVNPSISSLSPSSRTAGAAAFTLTVNGANFASGMTVNWNGTGLTTTFVSATQLTAAVPANLIASAGTAPVTVSGPNGALSAPATFTITPAPAITTLNPASVTEGAPAFTLTVNGTNLVNGMTVRWNGSALTTTFVSATQLTAAVPASLVASAGTASVVVRTTDGVNSNTATFTIGSDPSISTLSPSSRTAGATAFTLTVNGANFVSGMVVNWSGSPLSTTFVSATQLTAAVAASLITTAGTRTITVSGSAGALSGPATFTVRAAPAITTLSPTAVTEGAPAFTLTVNGTTFVSGMTVRWNGSGLTTTFVNATPLTAAVPASLVASPGTASVTVLTADAVSSNPATFTIRTDPTITSLSPSSRTAGAAAFTLTVNGANFVSGMSVNWNGASLTTTFGSATQLTAAVPANLVAGAGTAAVTVSGPDGSLSAPATFTITPAPVISTLSPSSVTEGAPAFTLTVNGSNFVNGMAVRWNATSLTTTYVSATQLTAAVPATLVSTPGTASVTVLTADGVSSNAATFTTGNDPSISTLIPASRTAGSAAFTLTVNGANFTSGMTVNWNGSPLTSNFVSATQMTADVPANLIATAGTAAVTVSGGAGALSGPATFTIAPAPSVSGLNPSSVTEGAPAFTLTVSGKSFASGMTVRWSGADLATTFLGSTQLNAAVPAALVASPGTANVTVFTVDGVESNGLTFTIGNDPSISTLAPPSRTEGAATFTLAVNGANFASGMSVNWNGIALATTYVNATQLTAIVPADLIASAGTASVTVVGSSGALSAPVPFIISPAPAIETLNPPAVTQGSPAFTLTVIGDHFVEGMAVRWNGAALTTTFVSATQLTAEVSASLVNIPGSAVVTVFTADQVSSNEVTFRINSAPAITSLNPSFRIATSPDFVLNVNGANFANGMTVRWNGTALVTTFASAGQLTAAVPAALVAAPGTALVTVRAQDSVTSAPATFNIIPVLRITSGATLEGLTLTQFSFGFAAAGGAPPYTWSLSGNLPSGLSLNATTGVLSGEPQAEASVTLSITVADTSGQTASMPLSLVIRARVFPLVITTRSPLPAGTRDQSYAAVFGAGGGTPGYSFQILRGSLPPGLSLAASGNLTGTPTNTGTFNFTVEVTDSQGRKAAEAFTLVINAPPLTITNNSPLSGVPAGSQISEQFVASGGVPPYVFAATGSLPSGTTLTPTGHLSGVANSPGTFAFTIAVRDSENNVAVKPFTIVIGGVALSIVTQSPLPDGEVDQPYSTTISATGGTQPYSWTLTGVPGLSINSAGTITGVATTVGKFNANVSVSDNAGANASRSFELTILAPPLRITTDSLPGATVNVDFSVALAATGGVKPYSWSITGLPAGLSATPDGSLSGKPTIAGAYTINAVVTDSRGTTASRTLVGSIAPQTLSILTSTLGNSTVGTGISASFAATGGVPPLTWSASGLPPGITFTTEGILSGTPAEPGSFALLVTVTDSTGVTATRNFTAVFALPPPPPVVISGAPEISSPATQPRVEVGLTTPYPVEVIATVTLSFAADSGPDDPAVQLSSGGRTARITIPAGQTKGTADLGIQTGTVAGLITVSVQLEAAESNVTPTPTPTRTIRIDAAPPSLGSVQARRTATGFEVIIAGFSTSRDMRQAIFRFTAAPGASFQPAELTIPVDSTFAHWYQDPTAAAFGSQFVYTQPFTISGDSAGIVSVTVILANQQGQSAALSAPLQ